MDRLLPRQALCVGMLAHLPSPFRILLLLFRSLLCVRSIFATYWWVTRTAYTGDVWMPVMTNAIIHTIMYFYFLLTCFGVRPTWDSALTLMQLIQFCVMISQGALNLAYGCPYPRVVSLFYVGYITFMLALFLHFFTQKYCRAPRPSRDAVSKNKAA